MSAAVPGGVGGRRDRQPKSSALVTELELEIMSQHAVISAMSDSLRLTDVGLRNGLGVFVGWSLFVLFVLLVVFALGLGIREPANFRGGVVRCGRLVLQNAEVKGRRHRGADFDGHLRHLEGCGARGAAVHPGGWCRGRY